MPLPLANDAGNDAANDADAIARSLWFATNRGYGKALDSLPQGEDRAAGARQRRGRLRRLFEPRSPSPWPSCPMPRLLTSSIAPPGRARIRELSGLFKQYPRCLLQQRRARSLHRDRLLRLLRRHPGRHAQSRCPAGDRRPHPRRRWHGSCSAPRPSKLTMPPICRIKRLLADKTLAMGKNLEALREAPVTEPFNGPCDPQRTRLRRLLPRGPRPPSRRPAAARRRGGPDLHQAPRQTDPAARFSASSDDPTLTNFDGTSAQRTL